MSGPPGSSIFFSFAFFEISCVISAIPLRSVSNIAWSSQSCMRANASTVRSTPDAAISPTSVSQIFRAPALMPLGRSGTPGGYCGSLAGSGRRARFPSRMRMRVGFGGGPLKPTSPPSARRACRRVRGECLGRITAVARSTSPSAAREALPPHGVRRATSPQLRRSLCRSARCPSCRHHHTFGMDLRKGAPVALQHCDSVCELLPAGDYYVRIFRIEFHRQADSASHLAPKKCASCAAEQIHDDVASLTAIDESAPNQLHRLHGWVEPVGRGLLLFPQRGLRFVSVPRVLLPGDMAVKDGLVLEFVAAKAPRKCVLRPDNLATHFEAGCLQRVLKLALPGRGVANIERCTGLYGCAKRSK